VEDFLYRTSQPLVISVLAWILALLVSSAAVQILVHAVHLLLLHLGHPFEDLLVLLLILVIRLELMPFGVSGTLTRSLLLLLSMHFSHLREKLRFLIATPGPIIIIILIVSIQLGGTSLILILQESVMAVVLGFSEARLNFPVRGSAFVSLGCADDTFRLPDCFEVAYAEEGRGCTVIVALLSILAPGVSDMKLFSHCVVLRRKRSLLRYP
jgi:hypothetical protein